MSETDERMILKKIDLPDPLAGEGRALYEASFPANERRPLEELVSGFRGKGELLAALEGGRFVGMISLLSVEDITHILYFAVREELRNRGYGSRILALIRERYPCQRIIADLERPEEGAPNGEQRERRVAFYRNNGYVFTEVAYRWEGEDYCIMSSGGNVSREEFRRFWEHFRPKD